MLKWSGGLVLLLVAACGTVLHPPDPDRRLNVQTAGTMFDADRGYRFIVLPDPTSNVVRLDVRYIETWSLAMDMRILFLTAVSAPFHRTAY